MPTLLIILIALVLPCYLFAIYMHFKKKRKKKEAEEKQKYVNWQMQRKRDRFVNKIGYQITSLFYDGEHQLKIKEVALKELSRNINN